jgi:hypothetical protein
MGRRDVWTLGNGEVGTSAPQKASGGLRLLLRGSALAGRGRARTQAELTTAPAQATAAQDP